MNNPYRARPGRPQMDHTGTSAAVTPSISNLVAQNQNSWTSINSSTQATDLYNQSQQSNVNQPNQISDSWDWNSDNVDNANDAWNWSIDQFDPPSQLHQPLKIKQIPQQENQLPQKPQLQIPQQQNPQQQNLQPQIPQLQTPSSQTPQLQNPLSQIPQLQNPQSQVPQLQNPHQQIPQLQNPSSQIPQLQNPQPQISQQRYESSYSNLTQPHQNYVQDSYYTVNGNNRPNLQIQNLPPTNTSKITPSRESTPNPHDSNTHYMNYNINHQLTPASRPSSTKSNSSMNENQNIQSQWHTNQTSLDRQDSSQFSHVSYFQPTAQDNNDITNRSSMKISQQSPTNNYNWNNMESSNVSHQYSWQGSGSDVVSQQRMDTNYAKEDSFQSGGNQWSQQQLQQQQQIINPPRQSTTPPSSNVILPTPAPKVHMQNESASIKQSWQFTQSQGHQSQQNQWSKRSGMNYNKIPDNNSSHYSTEIAYVNQDWQRDHSSIIKLTSNLVISDSKDEGSVVSDMETPLFKQIQVTASESGNILTIENTECVHAHENIENGKKNSTTEEIVNDLSANVNKSNLVDNGPKNFENLKPRLPHQPAAQWSFSAGSQPVQLSEHTQTSDTAVNSQEFQHLYHDSSVQDVNVQQSLHHHQDHSYINQSTSSTQSTSSNSVGSVENIIPMQQPISKLVLTPQTLQETRQPTIIPEEREAEMSSRTATQTGYDQWYNQNSTTGAPSQLSQQTPWYSNISRNLQQKQWTSTDSSGDSYEPIHPPTELLNIDTVLSEPSSSYERDNRESREPTTKDNILIDSKPSTPPRDTSTAINAEHIVISSQSEHLTDNYEFASNDRNTFLETGELTDSHQEHTLIPPSQEDENDDVPGDIPFLREVPGQSSNTDPRRNDPTGQEQYIQSSPRLVDSRRNDRPGQAPAIQSRSLPLNERSERRDVPSGEERRESVPVSSREAETIERRNDPSGRERSLPPPVQSRNDPSGEERIQSQSQITIDSNDLRQIPGSGVNVTEAIPAVEVTAIRQIPGGLFSNDALNITDNMNNNARVVTGSQELPLNNSTQDISGETRNKREEAVGASTREDDIIVSSSPKRRDSYEDGDDEESGNSQTENRERRRDSSPNDKRRYDYDRKGDRSYYDRDRDYDDEYYYERRRGLDYERTYNSREDLDRREASFRESDRRHPSRDDLDERRGGRLKEEDDRELRRRDERRGGHRIDDPRRRDGRDYDPRYQRDPRDREHADRDRRRDDRRRRYDEYDSRDPRREYYDDPYTRSSRPSSRSSYNDRERDYYMRSRDPYYGYNSYGAYDYGANYNANYYAYLENLRRTNPTAYMEWYHKYYASQQQHQQQPVTHVPNYPEDRASVHSGRSSCDDRLFATSRLCSYSPNGALYVSHFGCPFGTSSPVQRRRPNCRNLNRTASVKQSIGDISLLEDSRAISRMTPTKFSTSHVQGSFSIGCLLHVYASYPADGERARVDTLRLDSLLQHDPVARELRSYPGPFIKGVTHKKTIIEYCETKIKKATVNEEIVDRASYILLYQLMILLIQQNGNVVGVDIAALLLRNKKAHPYDENKLSEELTRRASTVSQRSGGNGRDELIYENGSHHEMEDIKPQKTVEQITNEFRNTLLDGLVQQALEYAMNEGLWGHALFLASKLDKRTHASIMTRFANSLPVQDPLQTLYQLHSGRVPASMTCVADWKWDDWRPHLAMVISNPSANPEINRRSITTLGDTLAASGDIHAAHFCYILAEIEFGVYGTTGVKLVLIGANHHKPYTEFATPEAIILTEIYEYARNLSEPGCTLVGLQTFKLETAQKMVDYGLIEKALLYLEQIAINIVNDPTNYKQSFINDVYTLSERIKFHDPVFKDCTEDDTVLAWVNNLSEIVGRYQSGEFVEYDGNTHSADIPQIVQDHEQRDIQGHQQQQQQQQQQWVYGGNQDYTSGPVSMMEVPTIDTKDQWQPLSLPENVQEHGVEQNGQYLGQNVDQYRQLQQQQQQQPQHQSQQEYWSQHQYNQQDYTNEYQSGDWQQRQSQQVQYQQEETDVDSSHPQGVWNYEPQSQQQISMGPSSSKQYDPLEELDALEPLGESTKQATDTKKVQEKYVDKKTSSTGSGGSWFGGLFSKLTPKPKNQMILPDDNNPTIVWDPIAKKWMNKDEDGDSGSVRLAPPPKAADMGIKPPGIDQHTSSFIKPEQSLHLPSDNIANPNNSKIIGGSNMFKLQKARNMRANYIDVMNPGGIKNNGPTPSVPTPATSPLVPMAASSPQFFTPQTIQDPNAPVDFLTPATSTIPSNETTSQGLSRWSSTSSLSREVQSYTMRDPRVHQKMKGPMMYNPVGLKDNFTKNISSSRYSSR